MPRYKMVGNTRIELTSEELAEVTTRETEWNDGALDRALLALRNKRNELLTVTDWTANSDVTMSSDMTTYRQALRDLPSGLDTVEKVNAKTFPTKP